MKGNKHNWWKILITVVFFAFFGMAIYINSRSPQMRSDQARIAVNLPLSGPISTFSIPYVNGLKMGIADEIETLKLPSDTILLDVADNKGNSTDAVSIFRRQNLHHFDAYISGSVPQSRAIMHLVDATNKPHFQIGFLENTVKDGKNRIRIFPHFGIEKHVIFNYLKKIQAKKVAFIFHNDEGYLKYFTNSIVPFLEKNKIEYYQEIIDLNTYDYRTIVYKLLSQKPDTVIGMSFSVEMLRTILALKEAEFVKINKTFFNLDFLDLIYGQTNFSITKDVVFTGTYFDISGDANGFKKRYFEIYNKKPTYVAAYGYDTGRILVRA